MTTKTLVKAIPLGYSQVIYDEQTYGLNKTVFNKGKSVKIYAEELGGTDFISCNFYSTQSTYLIKPCEMPESKVLNFLNNFKVETNE